MRNKYPFWSKWLYWFTFAVGVIFVYNILNNFTAIKIGISNFLGVMMPFIIGIIIAYILYIPARNIEKLMNKIKILNKKARAISIIITYILAMILLIVVINNIIPIVVESISDFVNHFQEYYNIVVTKINELPDDSVFKSDVFNENINKIGQINIAEYVNVEKISQYAQGAISIATGIFDFFVSVIVSAYILLERREIVLFAKKLVSSLFERKTCEKIRKYFNTINEIFLKFLGSQLLDAIVVSVLTSIAMSIMGVKYAVVLGIMIGVFNMIPYFGAIIAVVITTIITFITGGFSQALWMVIVITILQQIDANIINPKIVGDSLKISPLLVIFAVTVGGAYFGILGMFLAVPVVATMRVFISDYIDSKNNSELQFSKNIQK